MQADLNDLPSLTKYNKGYRYILTVIDIFSRYAYAKPMKTKTGAEMIQVFKSIFAHMKPTFLQTDDGMEFKNKLFQTYLKDMGIGHFSVKGDLKACFVERYNRTLKSKMFQHFTYMNTHNWVNILQDLVTSYNNRPHSSLPNKLTPKEALGKEHEYDIWKSQVGRRKTQRVRFSIGDHVRLSLPNWTEELFEIISVDTRDQPPLYVVQDHNGDRIEGIFYADELQKVQTDLYPIEKIYRRKGNKYLVKFVAYPDRYWIDRIHKQ